MRHVAALAGRKIVLIHSANGCEHFAAVSEDGELYTCGYNARGQLGHGVTSHVSSPRPVTCAVCVLTRVLLPSGRGRAVYS